MEQRQIYQNIWQELSGEKSMVFLAGPRQAGKTTLARLISKRFSSSLYFNWDIPGDRTRLLENPVFFEKLPRKGNEKPLVIFDEIHKYRQWKNYLKGVYDQFHGLFNFLVTGSGRLDLYQKGGDSLAGRYFMFHLWPFTLAESAGKRRPFDDFIREPLVMTTDSLADLHHLWDSLEKFSGFPEPFLSARAATWQRWSNSYAQQLIREDIRDLTEVRSVRDMETLYYLLPSKIASPLSAVSIARDLGVSYNSIQNWLSLFERFYLTFSISPWSSRIARSILKERKVYLFDTPRIKEPAARFENMVAIELWRAVTNWNDLGLGRYSLHFIKNKEQQEVDFLIAQDNEPFLLVEAKLSETQPSVPLRKFQQVLDVPAVQLTNAGDGYRLYSNGERNILVTPAWLWLSGLP